jgi:hypothetical protein
VLVAIDYRCGASTTRNPRASLAIRCPLRGRAVQGCSARSDSLGACSRHENAHLTCLPWRGRVVLFTVTSRGRCRKHSSGTSSFRAPSTFGLDVILVPSLDQPALFVPERNHGVHLSSPSGRHVARQQRNTRQQHRDPNVGDGIIRCYPHQKVAEEMSDGECRG